MNSEGKNNGYKVQKADRLLRFNSPHFHFSGTLDDSKSIVNRLLVAASYFPDLSLQYQSAADDVIYLETALKQLKDGKSVFDIGAGGTSLRFFLGRLSRQIGEFQVKVHPALLARPQQDLYKVLGLLGTRVSVTGDDTLYVQSKGWGLVSEVEVNSNISSQFVSSILLNSWNLSHKFKIKLEGNLVSESFFELTKNVCRQLGMKFQLSGNEIILEPGQSINKNDFHSEVDASSLFTLACFALQYGNLQVKPCTNLYGQPDFAFIDFFKSWNIPFEFSNGQFTISKHKFWASVKVNIANCPDLFPVMCAWLSFCDGQHEIFGAPHLVSKESNRIAKTAELLKLAGVECEPKNDGMILRGKSGRALRSFKFDPAHDHRMAFAAAMFAFAGFNLELADMSVVNKSFPQFWNILGLEQDGK